MCMARDPQHTFPNAAIEGVTGSVSADPQYVSIPYVRLFNGGAGMRGVHGGASPLSLQEVGQPGVAHKVLAARKLERLYYTYFSQTSVVDVYKALDAVRRVRHQPRMPMDYFARAAMLEANRLEALRSLTVDAPTCPAACDPRWIGDGQCDPVCSSAACDYDGNDCAHQRLNPAPMS